MCVLIVCMYVCVCLSVYVYMCVRVCVRVCTACVYCMHALESSVLTVSINTKEGSVLNKTE